MVRGLRGWLFSRRRGRRLRGRRCGSLRRRGLSHRDGVVRPQLDRGRRLALDLDQRDLRPGLHGLPLLGEDLLQDPGDGRGHLGVHLVGVDLEHRLELNDPVARLDQPSRDRAFVHRLAELGHDDASRFAHQ